jgi:peptidoglycan hydrolase CwlO-like protein
MTDPADAAGRLENWTPLYPDLAHVVADTWRLVAENNAALTRLENLMADTSPLLNEVAADMARLAPAIAALVDENTRLAARNAELAGEDAAETTAATNVKTQWDNIASRFTDAPDVPDVPPVA